MTMRLGLTIAAIFGLAMVAGSQDRAGAAEPNRTAFLASGQQLPARLAGIDDGWKISLRGEKSIRVLPAADLALWGRFQDVERGPQIILADGSLIAADVLDVTSREVTIGDATGLGRVLWSTTSLPRPAVLAVVYQPSADERARDKLLDELVRSPPREDELRLLGGEVIRGTLVVSDPKRLGPDLPAGQLDVFRFTVRGRSEPLSVNAAKVETLVLGTVTRGAEAAFRQAGLVTLGLRDGSLVTCRSLRVGKSSLELELAAGGALKTTLGAGADQWSAFWDEVTLIQPRSERVSYLSERETIGYKHIPYTELSWDYGRGRSTLGGRLRSDGSIFLQGLGMHSAARLAYEIEAGWQRLESEIALDASAGLDGSVIFKVVLADPSGTWRTVYESPIVRGGDPPRSISVDLGQSSRVALLVEYADRGDVLDHANWLNVRLVK